MIINDTVSTPLVSTFGSTPSRFKIKASAKAFKILSGFYSEPILAIPRELGANAWDSHVKAGNTKTPFEVHAPNTLEPWFSIRDFGTGLSPEDIDQIYTTYFESTKTSDNDSDGCMGLGSKTPFNYADNFTVTSWFKGKKHVYNCFIDETGSPNIMHIVTEESKEHSGMEVKFAVKLGDISMWIDRITRAYAPFRNRPVIKGANITFEPREYIYQGTNWAYRKNEGWNSSRGVNAFMGNYCYTVNMSAIRDAFHNEKDGYELERAVNYGYFDLFYNIGDLEVAPNKEQLQYENDNSTTKRIIASLRLAMKELTETVTAKLATPATRWEAMGLYAKCNGYNSEYSSIRSVLGDLPIKFNNSRVTSATETVSSALVSSGVLPDAHAKLPPDTFYQLHVLDSLYGKIKRTSVYQNNSGDRKVLFFYTNSESIKNARLRHYMVTNTPSGKVPICYIVTDTSKNASVFHAQAKYFGWDKSSIINIDALPKPPPIARAKTTTSTDEIFVFDTATLYRTGDNSKTPHVYWKHRGETVDSTKTYYYVDFLYYSPAINGANVTEELMSDIIAVAVDNKLLGGAADIFGINAKNRKLLKVGKWINVVDLVRKYIAKDKSKFENDLYLQSLKDKLLEFRTEVQTISYSGVIKKIKSAKTKAEFNNLITCYKKYVEHGIHVPVEDFYKQFGITAKNHGVSPIDIAATAALFEKKYMGIFEHLSSYSSGDVLANLINFIDEKS